MKKPVKKLARLAEQFQAWALEESLPLWWKANRLANGAFYEALDFEGRPVPEPRARVRVQARQVYALALGWKLGFRKKSLPAKLESSIERFFDTCLGPEGLPGRIVNVENGELVDPRPELYNTGFALMALAQSRKVLGGRAVDGRIGRLFDRIDEHLAHNNGDGYREFLPPNTIRLQNPHMHFFESLLVLYKATKNSQVQDRAEALMIELRGSEPFSSMRYHGHMNWDAALPGMVGYVAGMLIVLFVANDDEWEAEQATTSDAEDADTGVADADEMEEAR